MTSSDKNNFILYHFSTEVSTKRFGVIMASSVWYTVLK